MGINLLDTIKSQIGGELIGKAASFLGENPAATKKAMDVLMPSLLGGVVNQTTSISGATNLMNSLSNGGHDGSIFGSLGTLLGGGSATQGLINSGNGIVKDIFGDKIGGIVDWISAYAGIGSGSTSSLMNMAAPMLMGALGKQVNGGNLGVSGLMNLLGNQTEFIKKALPTGLSSVLGLSNLKLDTPSVSSVAKAERMVDERMAASVEKPLMSQLMPWLLLLGAGLAGLFYLRTCNTKAPEPPQVIAVPEPPKVAQIIVDSVKKIKLPEGEITVKTGSFLDRLNDEILDPNADLTKALTFDNVNFSTGAAEITEGSKTQLDDLVKIMKAYPKVEIKVDGHTDNKGDEAKNKALSSSRAESVKTYLKSHGIDAARISTAGFGPSKPVAENETEEGRAKNRRIEAFVTKK